MPYTWQESVSIGTLIKASHINEIQTASNAVITTHCPSNYTSYYADRRDYGDYSYDSSDDGDRTDYTFYGDNVFNLA